MTDTDRKQAAAQEYLDACSNEPLDATAARLLHEAGNRVYDKGGLEGHLRILGTIDALRVGEQVAFGWDVAQALLRPRRRPVLCKRCKGEGFIYPVDADGGCEDAPCSACGKDGCGPGVVWEEVKP